MSASLFSMLVSNALAGGVWDVLKEKNVSTIERKCACLHNCRVKKKSGID